MFGRVFRRAYSSVNDGIIVYRRNDKAILQFNRPEKLNAMSNQMQIKFATLLRDLESDSSVSAVIIKGNEIGFSAGGDVVEFAGMIQSDNKTKEYSYESVTLFYRALLRLAEYKKPVIPLADQICIGFGAATTFLASHPVITERTIFAMPEIRIGFYANVGANYFLGKLPNNYGMWIGLTGERFIGSDIIHLGLTKNFVKSKDLNALEDAIVDLEETNFENVSHTIAQFQQNYTDSNFHPDKVKQLFDGNSVEQIVENLRKDDTEFSAKILQLISTLSPTGLKLTFNILRESQLKHYSKNEALSADFSLLKNFYGETGPNMNDFSEGIRSVLIDKKHKPNWIPKTLREVDDTKLISYFTTNITDIRASCP